MYTDGGFIIPCSAGSVAFGMALAVYVSYLTTARQYDSRREVYVHAGTLAACQLAVC